MGGALERLHKRESRRTRAALVRSLGDVDLAEGSAAGRQDKFIEKPLCEEAVAAMPANVAHCIEGERPAGRDNDLRFQIGRALLQTTLVPLSEQGARATKINGPSRDAGYDNRRCRIVSSRNGRMSFRYEVGGVTAATVRFPVLRGTR